VGCPSIPVVRSLNSASSPVADGGFWAEKLEAKGGPYMSIEAVLLIVILTFGFGSVLNRWDMRLGGLRRRRAGRSRGFLLTFSQTRTLALIPMGGVSRVLSPTTIRSGWP
jgi:hypothetical protein